MPAEQINLDAIRTTAEVYQDKLTAEIKVQEDVNRLAREREKSAEINKRRAMLVNAQSVLNTLQASKALEAIRDGVWEEGYVKSGISAQAQDNFIDQGIAPGGVLAQAQLISAPYPVLLSRKCGKDPEATIIDGQTVLSVSVLAPTLVIVAEQGLHDVNSPDNSRYILVTEAIRKYGLNGGLRAFAHNNYWEIGSKLLGRIDTSGEDAKDKFFYLLWQSIQSSRQQHDLPWEIRAWARGMLGQLPQELQETGQISPEALRHWGNRIRGGSRLGAAWFNLQDQLRFQLNPGY